MNYSEIWDEPGSIKYQAANNNNNIKPKVKPAKKPPKQYGKIIVLDSEDEDNNDDNDDDNKSSENIKKMNNKRKLKELKDNDNEEEEKKKKNNKRKSIISDRQVSKQASKQVLTDKMDSKDEIKRDSRWKYRHTENENSIYILRLYKLDKRYIYIGSTQNMCKRLAQHNCVIAFSSKRSYTRRLSCNGLYKWQPICVIGGQTITREHAYSIEKKLQTMKLGRLTKAQTLYNANDEKCVKEIHKLVKVLNSEKWTKSAKVLAKDYPLTIRWFDSSFRPVNKLPECGDQLFPEHIKESYETMDYFYDF